ncbi:hypothetical protein PENTCL1PPCAC_7410, partial [Pristionchus entomophagus]
LFQILFLGCALFNLWCYERMMMQSTLRVSLLSTGDGDNKCTNLFHWIYPEMNCQVLCTLFSLIGWNFPLFIPNLLLAIFKLWWSFIKRFDSEDDVLIY